MIKLTELLNKSELVNKINEDGSLTGASQATLNNTPADWRGMVSALSLVPGPIGTVFDIISVSEALYRKDYVEAALSFIGLIPITGDAIKVSLKSAKNSKILNLLVNSVRKSGYIDSTAWQTIIGSGILTKNSQRYVTNGLHDIAVQVNSLNKKIESKKISDTLTAIENWARKSEESLKSLDDVIAQTSKQYGDATKASVSSQEVAKLVDRLKVGADAGMITTGIVKLANIIATSVKHTFFFKPRQLEALGRLLKDMYIRGLTTSLDRLGLIYQTAAPASKQKLAKIFSTYSKRNWTPRTDNEVIEFITREFNEGFDMTTRAPLVTAVVEEMMSSGHIFWRQWIDTNLKNLTSLVRESGFGAVAGGIRANFIFNMKQIYHNLTAAGNLVDIGYDVWQELVHEVGDDLGRRSIFASAIIQNDAPEVAKSIIDLNTAVDREKLKRGAEFISQASGAGNSETAPTPKKKKNNK